MTCLELAGQFRLQLSQHGLVDGLAEDISGLDLNIPIVADGTVHTRLDINVVLSILEDTKVQMWVQKSPEAVWAEMSTDFLLAHLSALIVRETDYDHLVIETMADNLADVPHFI